MLSAIKVFNQPYSVQSLNYWNCFIFEPKPIYIYFWLFEQGEASRAQICRPCSQWPVKQGVALYVRTLAFLPGRSFASIIYVNANIFKKHIPEVKAFTECVQEDLIIYTKQLPECFCSSSSECTNPSAVSTQLLLCFHQSCPWMQKSSKKREKNFQKL